MISLTPKAPDTWARVWLRCLIITYVLLVGATCYAPPHQQIAGVGILVGVILIWSSLCSFWVETKLAITGLILVLLPFVLMLFSWLSYAVS